MIEKLEIRSYPLEIEIRSNGKQPKIVGYAVVFNSLSRDLGGFFEIIRPGTFAISLQTADVIAKIEHAGGLMTLGRTRNKTLQLSEDSHGLHVEIIPPETQTAKDVITLLQRGDLDQMSFGFIPVETNWFFEGKKRVREILKAELIDVSIVSDPAYLATKVAVRSCADIAKEGSQQLRNSLDLFQKEYELLTL